MAKAGKELYVGSLSYDVTEYELHKMFAVAGTVTSMHLITDAETGQFKGCGYVRMSTESEARDAIDSLDGAWLLDRRITVSYANPQKMKSGGGGLKGRFIPKWLDKNKDKEASAKPAKAKAATDKPAAAKSAAAKPAAAKPAAAKSAAAKPTGDKPAATRPATARPATARPATAKPAGAKPEARAFGAKPAAAKTAAPAKSRAAKPAGAKPAARTADSRPAAKPGSRTGKR